MYITISVDNNLLWQYLSVGKQGSNRHLSEWHGIQLDGKGLVVKIDLRSNFLRGLEDNHFQLFIYISCRMYFEL